MNRKSIVVASRIAQTDYDSLLEFAKNRRLPLGTLLKVIIYEFVRNNGSTKIYLP